MQTPIKITLVGFGKMGKTIKRITEEDPEVIINHVIDMDTNKNGRSFGDSAFIESDVVIDFSHASAVKQTISTCLEMAKPLVIGTTGWTECLPEIKELTTEQKGKVLYGSNFSLGVQLFNKLIAEAAKLYGSSAYFDAALNEVHHTQKADAPSGTALTLAKTYLNHATTKTQLGTYIPTGSRVDKNTFYVTAQRVGEVFGEHELRIHSPWDDIVIKHSARNRDGFAAGSVMAAKWLFKKAEPGFYLLEDVAEEVIR